MKGLTVTRDLLDGVVQSIKTMGEKRVLIGIPRPKASRKGDDIGNAALGYIHETGSGARNIPARPFLVPGVREAEPEVLKILKDAARQSVSFAKGTVDKGAVDRGLNAAGLVAQATVKRTLRDGTDFRPLSHATLAARRRKGFMGEKPLVRTGQLLNSITYVIRDRT